MKQYEKTGALIASVRKEKGLTQKELAVTLHVSDTTVSKWERGIGFARGTACGSAWFDHW